MHVLIAGAGALGSVFGGFLRLAGVEVTLLGRAAHLKAIAQAGLCIDGIWGTHHADGFATATDPLLQLSGKATLAPPVLRLIARSDELFASSAWYARKVDVTAGWETRFEFQLTHGAGESPEGLAFVIQAALRLLRAPESHVTRDHF